MYSVITIYTSDEAQRDGKPLYSEIIREVQKARIAARCMVSRGFAGCYENGDIVSPHIEILSYNTPLKIEIVLPSAECGALLPAIEGMVPEGIVLVDEMRLGLHRVRKRLIPLHIMVRDVMTSGPVTVVPETPVAEIIRTLLSSDFNSLPVIDGDTRPLGIITQGDLVERAGMPVRLGLLAEMERHAMEPYLDSIKEKKAGEIMSSPVITVPENLPLGQAVDIMLGRSLKRLPVTGTDGRLAGILSRIDVFRTISDESPDWEGMRARNISLADVRYVRDVARMDIGTVHPDTPIDDVIRLITAGNLPLVAVVNNRGGFLGLIRDRDLLGAFAAHRAGIWDYVAARIPFADVSKKHRELIEQTAMKNASQVMKRDIPTVGEETTIAEAIKIMSGRGIKRLPVVDGTGTFRGMVSRDSILRAGISS